MEKPRTEPMLPRPASASPTALRITVAAGPDAGLSLTVDQPRVLIGRGETADVRVTDRTVSQCHAELLPHEKGVLLCDLGSLNGVRVGPVLVERCIVPLGTEVTLGATVIRVDQVSQVLQVMGQVAEDGARPPARTASRARSFGPLVGAAPMPVLQLFQQLADALCGLAQPLLQVHGRAGHRVPLRRTSSVSLLVQQGEPQHHETLPTK